MSRANPRSPRSGPSCAVLVRHHLSTPSAPLASTSGFHLQAYTRRHRCALACLGSSPLVPNFRCPFFLDVPSSLTPESSPIACTQFLHRRHWLSSVNEGLSTPMSDHPLPVGVFTRLYQFAFATARRFAGLPGGSDRTCVQPTETFTTGLPMSRSPFSSPVITTVATEQFPLARLSLARMAASFAAPFTSTFT